MSDQLQGNTVTTSTVDPTPAPTEVLYTPDRIYRISITAFDYGYHVGVGCKEFAISETAQLISLLTDYINNPLETHKKFYNGELFKKQ